MESMQLLKPLHGTRNRFVYTVARHPICFVTCFLRRYILLAVCVVTSKQAAIASLDIST